MTDFWVVAAYALTRNSTYLATITVEQFLNGSILHIEAQGKSLGMNGAALNEPLYAPIHYVNRWIIGNPGSGKTTKLLSLAIEEMNAGNGVLFLDVNGAAETFLAHCPKRRTDDVLYLDPVSYPVGWNILDDRDNIPLSATLIRDTMRALSNYTQATPVMSRVLYAGVASLMYKPGTSLLDLERVLTDASYRKEVLKYVDDPFLLRRWEYWEDKNDRDYDNMIASAENKGGEFTEDPRIRRIMERSTFNLRELLFKKSIIVLSLPQGQLGSRGASLGSLFLAHVLQIVQTRKVHMPLSIFIDDFHHFDTPVLRELISSGRKYGVSLTLANQYLNQLSPELLYSVIGNANERIMFQMGHKDSLFLHETIPQDNNELKLHELAPFQTLVFDGEISFQRTEPLKSGRRFRTVAEQSKRRYGL
jgi:hypothetical protein